MRKKERRNHPRPLSVLAFSFQAKAYLSMLEAEVTDRFLFRLIPYSSAIAYIQPLTLQSRE